MTEYIDYLDRIKIRNLKNRTEFIFKIQNVDTKLKKLKNGKGDLPNVECRILDGNAKGEFYFPVLTGDY